jgi:NADPH:quinone reductase-like Zn-dependent oxidoreductase
MKAIVLTGVCEPKDLKISDVKIPEIKPGWILVKVKAFGLNHSELILRKYEADAPYIKLPIIPGIECTGEIADASDSNFKAGEKVVALMGGMGRSFNGSYAEYVLLPVSHVFKTTIKLDWTEMAAIPETFFTAYGSLVDCLQIKTSDILLVHGATSTVGYAAIQLAKAIGCTVIGTTRKKERIDSLKEIGADFAMLDDVTLTRKVFELFPHGITKVLELVGATAIEETGKVLKKHGILCSTGQLGGKPHGGFDPIKAIPNGVYLSSFYSNYPSQQVMDNIFEMIDENQIKPVIGRIFKLEEITQAHTVMEQNAANGKVVVVL